VRAIPAPPTSRSIWLCSRATHDSLCCSGSSWYHSFENFWYSSDGTIALLSDLRSTLTCHSCNFLYVGVKMDYSGHDSNFENNLVVVNAYDGQNCINGGGFPPGHRSNFTGNRCVIAGCRGSPRSNLHGPCENKIGNFQCDAENLAGSLAGSWLLAGNSYYTPGGNASLPCGVTIAAAAAQAKAKGGGPELDSVALPLPSDAELITFARATLGMVATP
jgi:hypothetical protein